jgi:hypothetical protein
MQVYSLNFKSFEMQSERGAASSNGMVVYFVDLEGIIF